MNDPFRLKLKFWGVRGSTPTPNPENLYYGGNTSCLEIRLPNEELIIVEGGSGMRGLGLSLIDEFGPKQLSLNIFLTHFHWDHIQGLPFFKPLYNPKNQFTFHSFPSEEQIRDTLEGQMTTPYFPIKFDLLGATRRFVQMGTKPVQYGDLSVSAFPLNHPQGACGYRIESDGAVIVFASDLEHGKPEFDRTLRQFAEGADILIYDAQYTPEEYRSRKDWGHSTYEEAAHVARDAHVERLILFHHDPEHEDVMLDQIVQDARRLFAETSAAQEGSVLTV